MRTEESRVEHEDGTVVIQYKESGILWVHTVLPPRYSHSKVERVKPSVIAVNYARSEGALTARQDHDRGLLFRTSSGLAISLSRNPYELEEEPDLFMAWMEGYLEFLG